MVHPANSTMILQAMEPLTPSASSLRPLRLCDKKIGDSANHGASGKFCHDSASDGVSHPLCVLSAPSAPLR
jgi:hypothetical protein